jgi:3-hydroxyacyl-[acyl-carrier-protein] dehydratase
MLLDGLKDVVPGRSGVGLKNVTISDPVFAGHFPSFPVYPGVLMIEGAGQTAGLIAGAELEPDADGLGFLASVKKFTFRKLVLPGDQLSYRCTKRAQFGTLHEYTCKVEVAGATVADGAVVISLGNRIGVSG